MCFEKNCVFIDKSGFNLSISRTSGWSKVGELAKTAVTKNKGTISTIISDVSSQDVINTSLREPVIVTGSKKRKTDGKTIAIRAKIGTRTNYFLSYLGNLVNTLNKHGMNGYYIIINNTLLCRSVTVREFIEERGYKCVYLPPHLPFLKPIKEF